MSGATVSRVSPLEERLNDVIRSRLHDKGATASDVADWTGISVLRVQKRMDNQAPWPVNELYAVALFLGTLPSVLVIEAGEEAT
ncbi:hypothetical protein [Lapillicoccus sp.]|uniref:hypothetical protein n=1 Tax=Lapillicoccus sp. TaxID=1909287 RepID=UPI00398344F7